MDGNNKEDMKALLDEFYKSVGEWRKSSPEEMGAFMDFLAKVERPKSLDTKTKELIAVALSVEAHCKWCIAFHTDGAFKAGATEDEIRESAWVAVLMGGGPSLSYMQLVEAALVQLKKK
ncbi:MAG: carboxymuconolactone decarboxylase family protein [Candidatus Thermoplasmatota archaeon]|jgi:AhpD family alkylhydroperoxidase|nr:carboxymuconolactone decarboxylase family protein [Candidatus Thermoplasmatota archaeon]